MVNGLNLTPPIMEAVEHENCIFPTTVLPFFHISLLSSSPLPTKINKSLKKYNISGHWHLCRLAIDKWMTLLTWFLRTLFVTIVNGILRSHFDSKFNKVLHEKSVEFAVPLDQVVCPQIKTSSLFRKCFPFIFINLLF